MISRFISRLRLQINEIKVDTRHPESYWVLRGKNVIGQASPEELRKGRQIETYYAIFNAIENRSLTQVVDLGCNVAALGQLLYYWGYSGAYVGIDTNLYALRVAKRNLSSISDYCHLANANIRALPFNDRSCKCVVMKDVLEHMEDFRPLLREAARISLRYIIVANFIPWTEGRTIIRRESQGFYHNMYNRHDVYSFAKELGLEVQEVLSALEKNARANEVVVFSR